MIIHRFISLVKIIVTVFYKLKMITYRKADAIPFDEKKEVIGLQGKRNLGKAFNGDIVQVKMRSGQFGYVSKVIERKSELKVFICRVAAKSPGLFFPLDIRHPIFETSRQSWKQAISTYKDQQSNSGFENAEHGLFLLSLVSWEDMHPCGKVLQGFPRPSTFEHSEETVDGGIWRRVQLK